MQTSSVLTCARGCQEVSSVYKAQCTFGEMHLKKSLSIKVITKKELSLSLLVIAKKLSKVNNNLNKNSR